MAEGSPLIKGAKNLQTNANAPAPTTKGVRPHM
jgi:hypothetical protein